MLDSPSWPHARIAWHGQMDHRWHEQAAKAVLGWKVRYEVRRNLRVELLCYFMVPYSLLSPPRNRKEKQIFTALTLFQSLNFPRRSRKPRSCTRF